MFRCARTAQSELQIEIDRQARQQVLPAVQRKGFPLTGAAFLAR